MLGTPICPSTLLLETSAQALSKLFAASPCPSSAQRLAKDSQGTPIPTLRVPPPAHPFFCSTVCPLDSSWFSNSEFYLFCPARWDYHTLLGFHLSGGAVGLISSIPSFRAYSPTPPVVRVLKQLLHVFCIVVLLVYGGRPSPVPFITARGRRLSLYCICWNSEGREYLLTESCLELWKWCEHICGADSS